MANRVGLTLLEPNHLDAALDLGCSVYLCIHADWTLGIVDRVLARHPKARILVRRWGGIDRPETVARQIADWFPTYAQRGVVDVIPANELDRREEGGHSAAEIADWFRGLVPAVKALCPGIRIHWPAPAHEPFYAEIGRWKPAAALADCLDGHWYVDSLGVDALGHFFESHFPGKEWFVTEYSSRGLNAPAPRLGVEADAYDAIKRAQKWQNCRGLIFFTWTWPGHEPGGDVEEIIRDSETRMAMRRGIADFSGTVQSNVPAVAVPQPAGHVWTKDLFDDGNDCIFSSITAALDAGTAPATPSTADLKRAYYRRHPAWNDSNDTLDLPLFWQACNDLGIDVLPLDVQFSNNDPGPHINGWLTSGHHPTVWIWLWNPATRSWLLHAVAVKARRNGGYDFYDPQRGIEWWLSDGRFFSKDADGSYAGHTYQPIWKQAAKPEAPTVKPPEGIIWKGSPNFTQGRQGRKPVAIVNHIMEGSLAACDSWFANRESQVSAHFGIGKGGQLHQYVKSGDTAWANGVVARPDTSIPWLADAIRRGINPNTLTVSIEHEGRSGDALTEAQYQKSLALHRYLIAFYGIPVNEQSIIGHNRIDGVNRARCPGAGFPWARLLADLRGQPAPQPAPTPAKPPQDKVNAIRDHLGAIWGHSNEFGEPYRQQVRNAVDAIKQALGIP